MSNIIQKEFGTLMDARNRNTGMPYSDWRKDMLNQCGLILMYASEKNHPNQRVIYFFPYSENKEQKYMRTSFGQLIQTENGCELRTKNSEYQFAFDGYKLNQQQKNLLCLKVIGEKIESVHEKI